MHAISVTHAGLTALCMTRPQLECNILAFRTEVLGVPAELLWTCMEAMPAELALFVAGMPVLIDVWRDV